MKSKHTKYDEHGWKALFQYRETTKDLVISIKSKDYPENNRTIYLSKEELEILFEFLQQIKSLYNQDSPTPETYGGCPHLDTQSEQEFLRNKGYTSPIPPQKDNEPLEIGCNGNSPSPASEKGCGRPMRTETGKGITHRCGDEDYICNSCRSKK